MSKIFARAEFSAPAPLQLRLQLRACAAPLRAARHVATSAARREYVMRAAALWAALLVGMLVGCGGSGGSSGSTATAPAGSGSTAAPQVASKPTRTPTTASLSSTDAARLLEQATFGPTPSEVKRVAALGFNAYLAEQLGMPASGYTGFTYVPHEAPSSCDRNPAAPASAASICARDNYSLFNVQRQFFENALTGRDQLRQRVAFALSQLFVVSGNKIREAYGMAAFQNLLLNDAFRNFRQVLEDVTLSPVMGHYLDMARNAKADPARGTSPNENYARELLQLFSIGVNKLNQDGSLALDAHNQPQPTYNQSVIEGFSSIFTGWTYPALMGAPSSWTNPPNFQGTMVSFPDQHDPRAKLLLDGAVAPAGQTPEADLKAALDAVFNHPNVAPFIVKQLIQHLITSNPSPAYVARIAAVFANNGQGVRGDLAAVVKAILADVEARGDSPPQPGSGHLREPALFITTLLRGLGGRSDGVFLSDQVEKMGQPLFMAPTVFNFYPPSYQLPGSNTLAPEFFIQDATTGIARYNFVAELVFHGGAAADPTVWGSIGTTLDLGSGTFPPLAPANVLLDQLSSQLLHGSLSSAARAVIASALSAIPSNAAAEQVQTAAYLMATSQQFQVEH